MKAYTSVTELIGKTPLVELKNIQKQLNLSCRIFAKLESFNPTGSIKDRAALGMIVDAINRKVISSGATIIEPTSGNTGIGIASICASLGFKAILVMPDTMSVERIKLLKVYGAQVVLTDGKLGMQGAIEKAQEIHNQTPNSFIPSQFDNSANSLAHYNTTAREIWQDIDGKIDYFVSAIGSAGTICGCSRYFKEQDGNVKVIGVEPESSPLITKGISGSHKIQGIGANFIPRNYNADLVDKVLTASDTQAYEYAKLVATREGLFVGISSGASLCVAIKIAKENENKNIVVIFPDSGDRYLSTELCK